MSKRANPKVIGAFVIGGFALAVGAVAVFASGQFLQRTSQWVVFFPHSVQGLQVGAPVSFRGVQIGAVTDIIVEYDLENSDISVPVFLEIYSQRVNLIGERQYSDEVEIQELIGKGLRAQLQQQSLVTGQQVIQLDFFPDEPPRYVSDDQRIKEFPAVASSMAQLQESISSVAEEAPALIAEATEFIESAGEILDDRNKAAIANILMNVEHFTATLAEKDDDIGEIISNTKALMTNLRETSEKIEEIAVAVGEQRDEISFAIQEMGAAGSAVTRMADQVNNMVSENRQGLRDFTSEGLYEFTGLAQDGQDMANKIGRVADQIERDPGRFFFGDQQQGVNAQ